MRNHSMKGEEHMGEEQKHGTEQESGDGLVGGKSVSRREFLRIAGVAGAAVGLGAGLGGLVAACGKAEETTTTAGPTTTAAPATTTTTAAPASTTTVSAGPEAGREIKVGVIAPVTGVYAVFAIADKWGLGLIQKTVGDTMVLGDGKSHKVSWLLRDTQSDTNRAAQVTSDLILNDKADILIVGGGPDTALPAADTAETLGAPLLGINCPWQAWVFGRGKTMDVAEKWVFGSLFGVEQATAGVVKVFDKLTTNKVVSLYLGNTADSQAWLSPQFGIADTLKAAGYTIAPYSLFNQGTEDYTSLISGFKKAGCELNFGSNPGKDFSVYWQQCMQQGYKPKGCIEVVGLSSYQDQVALGDAALGLTMGFTWHKSWPYSDLITGMTNAQIADDFETATGSPWNIFITGYARMGWAVDVLKRTKDFENKESVLEAIKTTKTELITGPIDMTSPVDPTGRHITPNIYKQPWGFGQLQKGTKWKIDIPLVAQIDSPETKVDRDPVPISYS
jgi:branched-chain amino acid transport system substrate-binding protein